ncbi:transcription factor bHLH168-like [Salvia hispanica]|uniref:transcription factor bHLH168-like n=1 Tax=Salvia hispanica TaxID=49212 RepID=UPI00200934A1|nr:transcription factor bHLH168-like [Salvia hispanica]
MKRNETSSQNKLLRKTIEKNRRIRMKALSFKLVSVIPDRHFSQPKELLSHIDQIDAASAYIKNMRERIEVLNRRKAQVISSYAARTGHDGAGHKYPILTVKELGLGVEVMLISGLNKNFMLSQVISVIEQEAAQVLSVNISRVGETIIHTIHAQAKISRVGVDTSRISDRIQEIISSNL